MPKIVDHDAKRREIIQTVWRLIANEGVAAVTSRRIAKEFGNANGMLLYYFRNKEEMLTEAYRFVNDSTETRFERWSHLRGIAGLRAFVIETLPLDETRLTEARIVVAFWQQAQHRPPRAEIHRELMDRWWNRLAGFLNQAVADGEAPGHLDIEESADLFLTLITGSQAMATLTPELATPERQVAGLDAQISYIRGAARDR
ncbi:TetR/AcrR family transcriptional regulator [Millisia brevis]|uniref:TetR/AcrR family transcriptional regulator n=1 Tax=Millisia brevis TaxID=264148 RepID=UPI0008374B73|nr:TetR family transcriptional regulator C-terminal domain-containing protein [Millisia brevis]